MKIKIGDVKLKKRDFDWEFVITYLKSRFCFYLKVVSITLQYLFSKKKYILLLVIWVYSKMILFGKQLRNNSNQAF